MSIFIQIKDSILNQAVKTKALALIVPTKERMYELKAIFLWVVRSGNTVKSRLVRYRIEI